MKTALTIAPSPMARTAIAPPPPARRRRPIPVEPLVFAVLLMALTLGINVVLPKADVATTADTAPQAQPAQAPHTVRVSHITQVN